MKFEYFLKLTYSEIQNVELSIRNDVTKHRMKAIF